MPLQLGTAKGLSFVNDWDKDIDRIYQREEYAARLRQENERKAAFYGEQLKRGHGSNPRTEAELDEYYMGLNKELADFVTENPDYERDVDGMRKFLDISAKYLNNPILQRDQQVKQEFDRLRDAVGRGEITKAKYEEEMAKYNEYIDPEKKGDPYVFTNFKLPSFSDLLKEANDQLQPSKDLETKLDPVSHTFYSLKQTDPQAIYNTARGIMANEESRLVVEKEYKELIAADPKAATIFPDATTYLSKRIEYGEPVDRVTVAADYAWQKQLEADIKGKGQSSFAYFYANELPKLRSLTEKNEKGVNATGGTFPTSNPAIALTKFAKLGGKLNLSAKDGIKVETENGYLDFAEPVTLTAGTAREYVNIGGLLYLRMDVSFETGYKTASLEDPEPMIPEETIKKYGFRSSQNVTESLLNKGGSSLSITKGIKNEGTVLVPINLDAETMTAYDDQFIGSVEHTKEVAPLYTETAQQTIASDPVLLRHEIRQRYGFDVGTGVVKADYDPDVSKQEGKNMFRIVDKDKKVWYVDSANPTVKYPVES